MQKYWKHLNGSGNSNWYGRCELLFHITMLDLCRWGVLTDIFKEFCRYGLKHSFVWHNEWKNFWQIGFEKLSPLRTIDFPYAGGQLGCQVQLSYGYYRLRLGWLWTISVTFWVKNPKPRCLCFWKDIYMQWWFLHEPQTRKLSPLNYTKWVFESSAFALLFTAILIITIFLFLMSRTVLNAYECTWSTISSRKFFAAKCLEMVGAFGLWRYKRPAKIN